MAETVKGYNAWIKRMHALRDGEVNTMTLAAFGLLMVRYANQEVPRKTGNLARTIRVTEINERQKFIKVAAGGKNGVGYAVVVEGGSRPHMIFPRRKKALLFSLSGQGARLTGSVSNAFRGSGPGMTEKREQAGIKFAKKVNHPGTQPHPFMQPAAERAVRDLDLKGVVITVWNKAA